jgi:hypothetical protein
MSIVWSGIRPSGGIRVLEETSEVRITEETDRRILEEGDSFWQQVNPPAPG